VARVAVVGVGAVGTAMAAAVQQAGGHELVLCARRPVDGLSLQSNDGWPIDIVAPVATEPDQLAPADWVLLAVKAYQARGTEGWLRRLCGAETTVVVLQNGIEQRGSVRGLVPDGAVVPAVVWGNDTSSVPSDHPGRECHALPRRSDEAGVETLQLMIQGVNFGTAATPKVKLAGVQLTVLTSSETEIVAGCP
jgi:ketopantoate reductase